MTFRRPDFLDIQHWDHFDEACETCLKAVVLEAVTKERERCVREIELFLLRGEPQKEAPRWLVELTDHLVNQMRYS